MRFIRAVGNFVLTSISRISVLCGGGGISGVAACDGGGEELFAGSDLMFCDRVDGIGSDECGCVDNPDLLSC